MQILDVNNPVLEVEKTSLYNIALEVCTENNIHISQLRSSSRDQRYVRVRSIFARQAKQYGFSEKEIANLLKRTRTTIYNYLN